MTPVVGSLIAQAGSSLLQGKAGRAQAMAEKQRADNNAFIGRTRAIQTDTAARTSLDGEIANMQTVLATNQQKSGVGTFEMMRELRDVRSRERRVAFSNEMAGVYDQQAASRNALAEGRASSLSGLVGAAGPSSELYGMWRKKRG